jgi:hypothetical protein
MTGPPQMPALPPILLPSTVYDPNTPTSVSTNNSPSTSGLFTPSVFNSAQPRDYFNSKPSAPQPTSQRPPSRSKVERVLGKSPLGSPAIIQERDARHDTVSGPARPSTTLRSAVPASRDSTQKQSQSAGHRQAPSRETSRAPSRDQHRRGSKDHHRSGSNTSVILEDSYQGTPPRSREKREKDKKTMLSRALQKANTAVLLDNAQNFEGAMEAYEDACKLLQQVMIRSSAEEDRRKLDAIVSRLRCGSRYWLLQIFTYVLTSLASNLHQSYRRAQETGSGLLKYRWEVPPSSPDEWRVSGCATVHAPHG